jgi:predicted SAM-dependent methyltransferase
MGMQTTQIRRLVRGALTLAGKAGRSSASTMLQLRRWPRARRALSQFTPPYKIHLGCGRVHLDGWVNVDADGASPAVDLVWDLRHPLPFPDDSCELLYSEHVLEHFTVEDGLSLLRECRRVLRSGGVLRIAMPSLDDILRKSVGADWRDQDWLSWPEYRAIQTRAEMLNVAFRWWGHQWLYDREELRRRLAEAGFSHADDCARGQSAIADLRERETRADSNLVCEARK